MHLGLTAVLLSVVLSGQALAATYTFDGSFSASGVTPNFGSDPAPFDPVVATFSITYEDAPYSAFQINSFSMTLGSYHFTVANVIGQIEPSTLSGGATTLMARIAGGSSFSIDLPTDFAMGIFLEPGVSGGYGLGGGWISYSTDQAGPLGTTSWGATSYYTFANPGNTVTVSGSPAPVPVPLPASVTLLLAGMGGLALFRRKRAGSV